MRAGAHTIWHLRKRTARLTLVALVAACSISATAQAAGLPAPVTATDAAAQVGQAAATAPATVADTSAAAQSGVRQTATTTASPAQPAVEQVAKTAGTVAGPAQPAVEATVRSVQGGAAPSASTGDDHQAATPPRRDGDGGPANRSGRNEPKSPHATGTKRGAAAAADAPRSASHTAADPSPASASTPSATASHLTGAGSEDFPTSPTDGSTPNGGSTASPFSSGFGLGGIALLAAAFILAGAAIKRRLRVDGAFFRPTLFVAVLERPG
jgi:hypothetical protein